MKTNNDGSGGVIAAVPDDSKVTQQTDTSTEHIIDGDGSDSPPDADTDRDSFNLKDVYNPHNLTIDELEMFLYEWEPSATSVHEYFEWSVIEKIRSGQFAKEQAEQEIEEVEDEETESNTSLWGRMKKKIKGGDTKVEQKKERLAYLNLESDSAHGTCIRCVYF